MAGPLVLTSSSGASGETGLMQRPEAAAVILAGERPFDGPVTLTADTAVTFGDIAGVAAELTSRDIRRMVVDDDEWVAGQVAHRTRPAGRPLTTQP